MATELIPVIDLRLLSQSEIATLANSSANAFDLRRCDDIVVPKIDHSVFNESAGSRKQTYSRINLAPPKPDSPSLPRRRGRPRSIPLHEDSTSSPRVSEASLNDPDRLENLLIASFLRKLFNGESISSQALTLTKAVSTVCADETNDSWKCILAAAEEAQKALVLAEDQDREILNPKGVAVDLVALGRMEDPFGEEMRRRTMGLKTEDQLLGFLSTVEGHWGSRRKRRRFVDASLFGDVLPRSWKLLLGLRRKEGMAWLDCRRYISPNGHQFMSCKEVSSYILSLQDAKQPVSDQDHNNTPEFDKVVRESDAGHIHQSSISNGSSSFSSPAPASCVSGNPEKPPEGTNIYSATPISYISCENKQQPLTAHQRRAKRRKLGKTFVDGVIIKDGKFECQFCHKIFSERHRYNGHIGAHVRYQRLNAELLANERRITDQSSWAVVPYASSHHTTNDATTLFNGPSTETITVKSSDDGHSNVFVDEGMGAEMKCDDHADCTFPIDDDLNTNLQGSSPMVTKGASLREHIECKENDCIIHCENYIETAKPKVSQTTAPSSPFSKTYIISSDPIEHTSTSEPKEVGCPDLVNLDGESCNAEEVLNSTAPSETDNNTLEAMNESGFSLSPSRANVFEKSECKLIDYPAQSTTSACDAVETMNESGFSLSPSRADVFEKSECELIDYTAQDTALACDNNTLETMNESGFGLSPSRADVFEKNECNLIDYTAQNAPSACDHMDLDINSCYLSLSMDMDVKAAKGKNDCTSPLISLASEFVKYDDKLMADFESHLFSLSAKDISTYDVEERDIGKSESKEGQDSAEFIHQFFDKDAVFPSGVPATILISSDFSSFSEEHIHGIEEDMDCALGADMSESAIHNNIDKPINELEFYFGGSDSAHDDNVCDELENDPERKGVDIGLCNSSWLQATNVLHVLDMLPDQCGGGDEDELDKISHKNKNLESFEGSRLGAIEPSDFALFTGQDSKTGLEDHHCSSFQLGWNISLGNAGSSGSFASICVWCSTEFSHDHSNDGPHSEALGFICAACKEKF